MSARYDCADAQQREAGLAAAVTAVQQGTLVVLPTDTVYGIGADAFTPPAISALFEAKGRGRNMPPPVLVGSVRAAGALAETLGAFGQDLIDEFWPGALTLVFRASPTLKWDLGDTNGTVAVRMPLHPVALELLRRTGPMAVSSANRHGMPAATTIADAEAQLGGAISVYLDDGQCADNVPSTILDLTGTVPRMLRAGAVSADQLRKVVPLIDLPGDTKPAEPHPLADPAESLPGSAEPLASPAEPLPDPVEPLPGPAEPLAGGDPGTGS
jgi:L-threonylcarbamoyladenylate synthase